MAAPYRVTKNLTSAQNAELDEAMRRAGHTTPQAMEDMIAAYCQRWGITWTPTKRWGGKREKKEQGK